MNSGRSSESSPECCEDVEATAWVCAMRAGDFERAWSISDRDLAAYRRSGIAKHTGPRHQQRIWRGEELRDRRVLVRCYHGLGDTIQFARFLPALAELAGGLVVWCQPELQPLIERLQGVDRTMPLHDGAPDADFDVDIEIMEIPHAIRAGRELVMRRGPYLTLPPSEATKCLGRGRQGLAIGLVWEVGDWDKRRAVPPHLLKRLASDGVELFSFQRGAACAAAAEIGARDISTPDLITLGHRMGEVDLIVSVDTMPVHLAGALGHEAWVLLHADCDWRWPLKGNGGTCWYPRARLFHQHRAGEWSDVIEEVRCALQARNRVKMQDMVRSA